MNLWGTRPVDLERQQGEKQWVVQLIKNILHKPTSQKQVKVLVVKVWQV
jgi:hypothetical protein